ncbi:sigma-70 family RNA polymerase sigma factor [soil metagenome]
MRNTREMTAVALSPDTLEALSDEDLLLRAARGGEAAMAVLFDRHGGIMHGLALRITGDEALAQDAVQDAFVGIWRDASRFDAARASARSWMLAIARHRAIDAVRRRRPTSELPAGDAPPPAALVAPDVWGDVSRRLDGAVVGEALGRLAPLQRQAIEMAYFGGLTQQEIASRTGAPLGTVKSRVRLGLLALRTEIEASERPKDRTTGASAGAWEESA